MFRKLRALSLGLVLGGVTACGGTNGVIGGSSSGGAAGSLAGSGGAGSGGAPATGTGGAAGASPVDMPPPGDDAGSTADVVGAADGRAPGVDAGGEPIMPAVDGGDALGGGMYSSGGPFIGPAIASDCPDDPTAGWTEYIDTFHVEKPYDLPEADRFKFENGIFTFWVLPTDKPLQQGNTTAPRTEARWPNFTNSKPHLWSADVMFESPSNHVTIMQVHTTASGAGPVYLRVDDGNIHPLNGSVFVSGLYDKWFNLKVAIDPTSLQATVWINNCQKVKAVIGPRGDGVNYFKNGVYTCTSATCRDHYKNIHLYTK